MDKLIYTAMTGASHVMQQQAAVSQNLANTNTPGFRAAINTFRAVPLVGEGLPTRTFVVDSSSGSDFSQGSIQSTGGNLDVALQGSGWITLQQADGSEAYTRNGSFQISPEGVLQTHSGMAVASDSGPITIPPNTQVTIGQDGTVSTVPTAGNPTPAAVMGRIKLVNPPNAQMVRGDDGLFRTLNGKPADADANILLSTGSVENSNVNTVSAMVDMISLARMYDMQMKMLTTANENAKTAGAILTLNG